MSTKTPGKPRPAGQGSAGSAYVQPPTVGGTPRDRAPGRSRNVTTSIKKPGSGTRG